jgi:hypothetical protein
MTAAQYLADQLERLMALPLATAEDADRWNRECAAVQTALENQFPQFEPEHFVWHFFTDSDIRRKDAGYRQRQHRAVSEYIARLRHGTP